MLPISVDVTVRNTTSLESWRTERMARKDAAFQSYKALHLAGLVNDNLLPPRHEANEQAQFQTPDDRPSKVLVLPTFDPWLSIAQCQNDSPHVWYQTLLEVKAAGEEPMQMVLLTPILMPVITEALLYWNETKRYRVNNSRISSRTFSDEHIELLCSSTWSILRSIFRSEIDAHDILWMLAPCDHRGQVLDVGPLSEWHALNSGEQSALELVEKGWHDPAEWGIVMHQGQRFILKSLNTSPESSFSSLESTELQVVRFPKRRDFLHPVPDNQNYNDAYTRTESLCASECVVGNLPASYSVFSLLFPSILHRLEVYMIAEELRTTLLKPVSFQSPHLSTLVTALTSSATGEEDNYERLEFLGDAILKFISSVHLMAENLTWPESYLTGKKSKIVSNGFLARAALNAGLDQYIITKRFTGAKWKVRNVARVLADKANLQKEEISSKVVADVIESLIGASFVIGGLSKAFTCVQTLLPLNIMPIAEANRTLCK